MESSKQICADFKSILLEKHLNFELLNTYKGVPFICKAKLKEVEGETVCFDLRSASAFAWETVDNTLILSEGLLEPIEARQLVYDWEAGTLKLSDFIYAGSKLSNRKELRVEPGEAVEIILEPSEEQKMALLADLSMRGAGIRMASDLMPSLSQGKELKLLIKLTEGEVRLSGKIRNISRSNKGMRLSVEFIGVTPDKTPIVRYIMRRRAEILAEMRQMSTRG